MPCPVPGVGLRRVLVWLLPVTLAVGCGSGSGNGGTGPTPVISIAITPTSGSVAQGDTIQVSATLTRSGGFSGNVDLSVLGVPTGVTGAVSNIVTSGATTTATITIQVAIATVPGTYTLTVQGTGTGVTTATATFTLTVTAAPAFALTLTPNTTSIGQGSHQTVQVGISRTNFTSSVNLTAANLPEGVTAAFDPAAATGNSSVLTLTVGPAVPTGQYSISVQGSAPASASAPTGTIQAVAPANQTATLTLTVTLTGSFALSLTPSAVSIVPGSNGQTTVNIARTNFTGAVTLSLTGAPGGVTGAFNPTAPTGTSSTLTVTVGGSVATGMYNLTVSGTGTAGTSSTPLTLTVSAPSGSGNVTLDFSACPFSKPIWLASQDGNGPWTQVVPTGNAFKFNITSTTGAFAFVIQNSPSTYFTGVNYLATSELTGTPTSLCPPATHMNTLSGTVTNLGIAGSVASLSFGGRIAVVSADGPFQFIGVPPGSNDLLGYRGNLLVPGNERGFISRGLSPGNGGSVGTVDFLGAQSFAPATGSATVSNPIGGETLAHAMTYYTGVAPNACVLGSFFAGGATSPSVTFTTFGVPAANQVATDFHNIQIQASVGTTSVRSLNESFQDFNSRIAQPFVLPAALPTPTVSIAAGSAPYKRLMAMISIPVEYDGGAGLNYGDATNAALAMSLTSSGAWRAGAATVTLTEPDFSGVGGWNNAWAPPAANLATWSVVVQGASRAVAGSACHQGARQVFALQRGTL